MSLTNPNKPVTEARLQEFYHRIKSYLGFTEMPSEDMEEVISPLPSIQPRYHKYSTEEHIVGEWIDGKTLYEKTIVTTLPTVTTDGTYATKNVAHNISNVDTIFIENAFVDIGDGTILSLMHITNTGYQTKCHVNNTDCVMICGFKAYSERPIYITIQYTKSE